MKSKIRLRWKIYCFLFPLVSLGNLAGVLYPDSIIYRYYHILMVFHKSYAVYYYLNVISAVMALASLFALFFYVFKIRFLNPWVWQWFFVLRIFFDAAGHFYEFQLMKTLVYSDLILLSVSLAVVSLAVLPSYAAGFLYAFRINKIPS